MILAFRCQPDVKSSLDGSNIQHLINVSKHFILKTFFCCFAFASLCQANIHSTWNRSSLKLVSSLLSTWCAESQNYTKKKKKGTGHSINHKERASHWALRVHIKRPQWLNGHLKWSEVKVALSCLTLCKPMDYTVHGILQAKIPGWVAFPSSRQSYQPGDRTQVSRTAGSFFTSWATREAQEYWSGSLSRLQQIFPTKNWTGLRW